MAKIPMPRFSMWCVDEGHEDIEGWVVMVEKAGRMGQERIEDCGSRDKTYS